jgi:hypothetical protein
MDTNDQKTLEYLEAITDQASSPERPSPTMIKRFIDAHRPEAPAPEPTVKRPFVRQDHLTQRPLLNDERLLALKESLPQNKKTVHNSNPNRRRSTSKK